MPSKRKNTGSRNITVASGVTRFSRSDMYHRSGRWAIKNKKPVAAKAAAGPAAKKEVTFGKGKRLVGASAESRWYPTEPVKAAVRTNKLAPKPTTVRASITPGAVLILLAGRFKGKRVVALKVLPSGLVVVTGPYKINGVPIRRVNPRYVIATSTKINVSGVKVPDHINDVYFAKAKAASAKKSEKEFFAKKDEKKEKKPIDAKRVEDQKAVDTQVLAIVKQTDNLRAYLGARFSLSKGVFPHELTF